MNFHQHSSNNCLFKAPKGMVNCDDLPVTKLTNTGDNVTTLTSFWKPTVEELKELNDGGSVMLFIYGENHPPVALMTAPKV